MDDIITLSHGAGGKHTQQLIEEVFVKAFESPFLTRDDAAVFDIKGGRVAMTTDAFVVSPPFFSGGDIGKLSICGTVNDLACMGARPLYLTCSFIIEEGFKTEDLKKIAFSMADTAKEAGVHIVAGDTKVTAKGQCDGIFITTSGIGSIEGARLSGSFAQDGDAIIVTGDIGRHGCAILLSRDNYGISADISSDCAPLWGLTSEMLAVSDKLHVIRDATRGGVGTVLYEIAHQSGVCIELTQEALPVDDNVKGVCGLLGLEPLYMACEGRLVVFVSQNDAQAVLNAAKGHKYGKNAAIIGRVTSEQPGSVIVNTSIGGRRLLAQPSGELLPRIC